MSTDKPAEFPPRITVATYWADGEPFPTIYGCKVMEWKERELTEYISITEHQQAVNAARKEMERLTPLVDRARGLFMNDPRPFKHECLEQGPYPVEQCIQCLWDYTCDGWLKEAAKASGGGKP